MAWLTGFSNRIKLTILPDNVDSNLTDFPVMLYLSADSGRSGYDATVVFDELSDENYKRIAVTTSDGETQCPVEIEYWSSIERRAYLWTKVPTVYSSVDTDLYFYYDATYSGTTISGNEDYVGDINDTSYDMIIDIGDEATYGTVHMSTPYVIKESDTSYKMWYSGNNGNWRVLYAVSTDGVSWTGHQMVVDITAYPTYTSNYTHAPCIIKESDTSYKMWYSGHDGVNWRILYATSTDGINWSSHQMVVDINVEETYDTTGAMFPCVVKESDTSYKMWYAGQSGGVWRILYATSTDGTSWSNNQLVVSIGAEGTYDINHTQPGCIIKESDTSYKMWYVGRAVADVYSIIYTTSTNGTTWGNFEMVLKYNTEGTYDTDRSYTPWVIDDDGVYKLWYSGYDGVNYRIMYSIYWKTPAQDVWDDNFVGIWHLGQNPAISGKSIRDSSNYQNHGISAGAMTIGDLVDGKIGKALDFDGNNDYITLPNLFGSDPSEITFEIIFKADSTSSEFRAIGYNEEGFYLSLRINQGATANKIYTFVYDGGTDSIETTSYDVTSYRYIAVSSQEGGNTRLYVDNTFVGQDGGTGNFSEIGDLGRTIGASRDGANNRFDGIIDEVRVSKVERSSAWIKATYYSNWDNFVVFQDEEITINWLTDWAKRIKLIIPSTNIDSTLIDFPLAVTLASGTNTGVVFDELVSVFGTKKIAITESDGTSQCYVEIERWDWSASEANLWTKVPVVHNDEDTILYLYYDSTKSDNAAYVGDTGDAAAKSVWDDSFVGVWHMSQDPSGGADAIKDSTSNVNHGTSSGTMLTEDLVDGKIGKALDFYEDDYVNVGTLNPGNDLTIEFIYNIPVLPSVVANAFHIITKRDAWSSTEMMWQIIMHNVDNKVYFHNFSNATSEYSFDYIVQTNDYYHLVVSHSDGNLDKLYINSSLMESHNALPFDTGTTAALCVGGRVAGLSAGMEGIIDEVRISNVARSSSWIKATYYSNWNTLITYGSEQQRPIFLFYGYVKVQGIPAARTVYLYRRATGDLIESVVSDSSTGYFEIGSYYNEYHFVVVLPELTEGYNLIAYDQIDPGV